MPLTSNIVGLIAENDPVFATTFKTYIGAYNYWTHPANMDASKDKRPSIVLVHGAFLPSNAFALLMPLLTKAGYKVLTPALPSSNTNPATLDFSADVNAVRAAVEGEIALGEEVVVVMHSYGAVVGCEAMKGIKTEVRSGEPGRSFYHLSIPEGGVVKLIFISGQVLPAGYSCAMAIGNPTSVAGVTIGEDSVTIHDGQTRFYNDFSEPLAQHLTSKLVSHSLGAVRSPLTYPAYKYIPSSYLLCTLDKANPLKAQMRMVTAAGIKNVGRIAAGHMPFAHPEKVGVVARYIREQAGESFAKI